MKDYLIWTGTIFPIAVLFYLDGLFGLSFWWFILGGGISIAIFNLKK